MPTMVDLLERILEEQRRTAQFATQQEAAGVGIENARTSGQAARFNLEKQQTEQQGMLELAKRRYPHLDQLEALIQMKADDEAEERDVKRREAEGSIAYRDAQRASALAREDYTRDRIEKSPDELEAEINKRLLDEKRIDLMDKQLANMDRYGRTQAPVPPPDPPPKKLKPFKPNDSQMDRARSELKAPPLKMANPTTAQIRQRAWENFSSGYTPDELDEMGISAPDTAAGSAVPAAPPVAPTQVADEAGCRALGGTIGPDGKCHVSRRP